MAPAGSPPKALRLDGRVLFLTEDTELLKRQLAGENLDAQTVAAIVRGEGPKLIDNISTDEIAPGWVCFYYDETLGEYSLHGLRGGLFTRGTLKSGGFSVIVSGESKGCGSSREQAPYSEIAAGVKLVIARSIEKIYGQNCQNIGLYTSTDFSLVPRLLAGESIGEDLFRHIASQFGVVTRGSGLVAQRRAAGYKQTCQQ